MKNFKRFLSLALAVLMMLSYVPTIAYATEGTGVEQQSTTYVAKIGDEEYATFDAAIAAANGMTGKVTVEVYGKVEYTDATPDLTGAYDSINFVGKTNEAEISITRNGSNGYISGSTAGNDCVVTFTDLILSKPAGYHAYDAGFMNVAFTVYRVGSVEYTNCSFTNGACAAGSNTTYTGCTFKRSNDKYGLWTYGADRVVVDACNFDDYRGIKMYTVEIENKPTLTVKNTNFSAVNDKPAIVLTYGESVTLEGNTYSSTGVFELDLDGAPNGTTVTSTDEITCVNDNGECGVLVDGKIYTTVAQAAEAATAGSTVTLLHNSTETVEFAEGVILDKNGYTSENVTVKVQVADLYINNAEEFKAFAENVNNGNTYADKLVVLSADIDLKGSETNLWTPIGPSGDSVNKFKGTFDGQGHTISNLYVKQGAAYHAAGLFGATNGTVKNFTIDGAYVESLSSGSATVNGTAVVAGSTAYDANIENVHVKNATVKGNRYVAGIVGYMDGTVINCSVENVTITATPDNLTGSYDNGDKVGGIVGYTNSGATEISGCELKGTVSLKGYRDMGGIVGAVNSSVEVSDNTNSAAVTITVDQKTGYYGDKDANAGEFVGRGTPSDESTNNTTESGASFAVKEPAVAKIGDVEYDTLQAAINAVQNGETITLLADCDEDVTVEQKPDVAFTIDGANNKMTGTITVDGKSAAYATAGLTIKNIDFDATGITKDASINLGGNNSIRYTSNVTVEDCTFTGNYPTAEKSAVKSYTGGCKNVVVTDCTATRMHTLVQLKSTAKVTVTGCKVVDCKNGISVDSSSNVTISECEIEAEGYGIRANVEKEDVSVAITDCEIEAFIPVVIRKATYDASITFNGTNTMTASNTDGLWCAIGTTEYGTNGTMPTDPTGNVTVTLNDADLDASGVYGAYKEAEINGVGYSTLQSAINAGGEVKLLRDVVLTDTLTIPAGKTVTLDLAGKTVTYNSTTQGEAMITNKGTLTINDSVGTGVINYDYTGAADSTYSKGNYTISNAGNLTVNGGKITIANLKAHAKYPIDNNSTTGDAILVINGGHLYNYNTSAIRQFCNSTTNKNSVTINGGLIEGYSAIWVQNPGKNTVNGNLSITGGEIRTTAAAYVNGSSEVKDVSSKIYCTIDGEGGAWSEDSSVSITGGTINENVYLKEKAPETITVDKNGAIFNGRIEMPIVAEINGTEYESLKEAIDAAQNSDTVKLLANVTLTETLTIPAGKTVTLDLNGKTISMNDASGATAALIKNNGNLTIKDSAENGKITFNSTTPSATNGYASNTISNYGTLTIEGGTIENTTVGGACYALDNYAGSTATIKGGKLTAEKTTVRIFNWTNGDAAKATLNVEGGEIISEDGYGINLNMGNTPNVELNVKGGTITTEDTDYNLAVYVVSKGSAENVKIDITDGTFNGNFALNGITSTTMAEGNVSVSGGTIEGVICYDTPAYGFISGGTFGSDVSAAYCVEGFEPVDNGDGTYGVKVQLPEVVITDIKDSLKDSDPDLTFALNFAIKDVENLDEKYLEKLFATYGNWYTDYVLTISGLADDNVTFNANGNADGYLAGQYDAWSENWVSVPFEDVIVANDESLYIMEYAAKLMNQSGLRFTLAEVAAIVQNFDCGVYFTPEFLAANPNMKVSLQLKVFTEDAAGNKISNIDVATNEFEAKDIAAIIEKENGQTQYFATVAEAVEAAQADETVVLLKDVSEAMVIVPAKVTLDLAGKYLTAGNLLAFGQVADSKDGVGGVVISNDTTKAFVQLQAGNVQLPIYDTANGCYRFYTFSMNNRTTDIEDNSAKFKFNLHFTNKEAYNTIYNSNDCELEVNIKIGWTGMTIQGLNHTFSAATIKGYCKAVYDKHKETEGPIAADNVGFSLTLKINGTSILNEGEKIYATPSAISSSGVSRINETIEHVY